MVTPISQPSTDHIAQTRADLTKLFKSYRHDPVSFVRQVLGADPDIWQIEFLNAVKNNNQIAVKSGNGVGKSTAVSWLILWLLLTHWDCHIIVTGAGMSGVKVSVWSELGKWYRQMPTNLQDKLEYNATTLKLIDAPETNFAIARTTSKENPESVQGIHAKWPVFIVDEASGVDTEVFEAALGIFSEPNAKMILTGNPQRLTGFFYDVFHKNINNWYRMTVSALDAKHSKNGIALQDAARALGENVYRYKVLGEFPLAETDSLIPRSAVEAAAKRAPLITTQPTVWGLDVARHGDDRSVLAIRQGPNLVAIKTWDKSSAGELFILAGHIARIYEKCDEDSKPIAIYIDTVGMGWGVLERLQELGYPVRKCQVSERAVNDEAYTRLRDELWDKAREWFSDSNCSIPNDPELITELSTPTCQFESNGKMTVESKRSMKARGFRSPDKADAFIMTLMENPKQNAWMKKAITQDYHWIV